MHSIGAGLNSDALGSPTDGPIKPSDEPCVMQTPHHVGEAVGVVEAGVTGGRDDIRELVGRQAEVGHVLKAPVRVLDVHAVVLQQQFRPLDMHPSCKAHGTRLIYLRRRLQQQKPT